MSSVKDSLRNTIDQLNEEEAQEVFTFIQHLHNKTECAYIRKRLAGDPTFKIPEEDRGRFQPVQPVRGSGKAASKLLVEERQ